MVIQPNMAPKAIVEVWHETAEAFKRHLLPISEEALETMIEPESLTVFLKELNDIVGSSPVTCIEGG